MDPIGIDKIPIDKFTQGEDGSFAYLDKYQKPIMVISKVEYANAEKINQIIDSLTNINERLQLIELK